MQRNLKSLLFIVLLSLIFGNVSLAQKQFRFGVKIGLNSSDWTGKDADESRNLSELSGLSFHKASKAGFIGGGFITYNFNKALAIQPEILFSMKGLKYHADQFGVESDIFAKINYIEIPVLFKLNITTDEKLLQLFMISGPAVAFKLNTKAKSETSAGGQVFKDEEDLQGLKKQDFGLILGLGFSTKIGIIFEVRYNLGLSSITDARIETPEPRDAEVKNKVISVMSGFTF